MWQSYYYTHTHTHTHKKNRDNTVKRSLHTSSYDCVGVLNQVDHGKTDWHNHKQDAATEKDCVISLVPPS